MKIKHLLILASLFLVINSFGQTIPAAQTIIYSEDFTSLAAASTTYPTGIQGWRLANTAGATFRTTAPTLDQALVASSSASNNAGGVHNYNGKIGMLSSGSVDPAICLAVNTTGLSSVNVTYDVMTIRNPYDGTSNTRRNVFTLQYRAAATSGAFITLTGIEYRNNTTTQITAGLTTPQNIQTKTITLPAACDNQAMVQLRWVMRDSAGAGSRPSFAIDNIIVDACTVTTSTYFYRSFATGNWSSASSWEASPNGSTGWVPACTPPTSNAAGITIQNTHTITIDVNVTAPDITIDTGGTLQANSTGFNSLTIKGNIINNGTLQMYNSAGKAIDVIFNKNGNQSITGNGAITNFFSIGLNMGTSNGNVLDISSTNFSSSTNLLINSSSAFSILNGTIKFSGSYTFANSLFNLTGPSIPATTGIWLNNPNVTISPKNYSYSVSGYIRITSGIFNVGNTTGNSLQMLTNSSFIVEGGTVNVAGRIMTANSGGTVQNSVIYNQSGGTVNILTVGSGSPTLNGLELDNATSTFIMSGGTIVFRNQASAIELYNYATSVVTGGTVQFGDALSANITSTGFYINSPSTLPSIVINNSSGLNPVVNLYDNLTVYGSITINNGTKLDNGTYAVALTGNWNNSGTFATNSINKVTFNGTSAQLMTGATSTTFHKLTISNSSGGVTLQTPESVNNGFTLSNGIVYTDAVNLLTMNAGSSVIGANNASFVSGPIAKIGSTAFVFPVGKDLEYRPIADSALSGSETFTAEYFHINPSPIYDSSLRDPTIDHISRCEYWTLNRAGASTSAYVKLSWDTYSCGVDDLTQLTLAHWNGALWADEGNGGTTGTFTSGTLMSSAPVTSFSPFTLSSRTQDNPLPIELVSFTATYNGTNAVNLNWATASETNNDYFSIERSADGINFETINKTKGAGNSSAVLSYASLDNQPLQGVSYYRLKQNDFNGQYKYSATVSVNIIKNNDFNIINTSADSENGLQVSFNCTTDCNLSFELIDMNGKKVFVSCNVTLQNSTYTIPTNNFRKGIYLLKVTNWKEIITKKIVL